MAKRKRKKKVETSLIDETLLAIKNVPPEIIQAERVTEKILNKKLKPSKKASVQYKAAIKNYQTAVTRYKRSSTLLKKHYRILLKMVKQYSDENKSS